MTDTDYKTCAVGLGLRSWSGLAFNRPAGFFDVGLTDRTDAFLEELKERPMCVSRRQSPGDHLILATGCNDGGNSHIICNNPFPGPTDALQVTTTTATPS